MDNQLYQNGATHQGFIYQNPNYMNPPAYQHHETHDHDARNKNFKLATIYIKPQTYKGINSPTNALKQGTAFEELYSPFIGKGGVR